METSIPGAANCCSDLTCQSHPWLPWCCWNSVAQQVQPGAASQHKGKHSSADWEKWQNRHLPTGKAWFHPISSKNNPERSFYLWPTKRMNVSWNSWGTTIPILGPGSRAVLTLLTDSSLVLPPSEWATCSSQWVTGLVCQWCFMLANSCHITHVGSVPVASPQAGFPAIHMNNTGMEPRALKSRTL